MKKLFKYLLIVVIWAVIGAVLVAAAWMLDYPVADALILLGVLFVGWLVFLAVRRMVVRYRAKRRVQRLVNVEGGEAAEAGESMRRRWPWQGVGKLERRFKSVLGLLRSTRLKDHGDPVYVLPWYLMLGAEDSGKTTLLAQSELPAPTIDDDTLRGGEGSVEWRLYNQAILMDTPGSYLGDEKGGRDPEWPKLLELLARYREKEPLNGVVITVALETLAEGDRDQLFDLGRLHRRRVDELMRLLKLQLPVYIVVTQCDRVAGFQALCDALPKDALEQAMGQANTGGGTPEEFVKDALRRLAERVKELLLVIVNNGEPESDLICFPRRIEGLRAGLGAFADGLFQDNAYEESPLFRGLYLTGQDRPADLGAQEPRQAFSREFFTEILPGDRRLRSTLNSAERAQALVRRLALSGWGIAMIAAFGLLGWAYVSDKAFLTGTAEQYAGQFVKKSSFVENVDALYQLRGMILNVDQEVEDWWLPWFGLPGVEDPSFVRQLQDVMVSRAQDEVFQPLNSHFDQQLDQVFFREHKKLSGDQRKLIALYIGTLVRRINLLTAYLDGADLEALQQMPAPFDASGLFFDTDVDPATMQHVNGLYRQALLWTRDDDTVKAELLRLRKELEKLMKTTDANLSWLIPWANEYVAKSRITLKDFWTGSGSYDPSVEVPAAYTLDGKQAIDSFLDQLQQTDPHSKTFQELRAAFNDKYREGYLKAWEAFAENFTEGSEGLRGQLEWQTAVDVLATPRNPYFDLLDVMNSQLEPFHDDAAPEWAQMVFYYQEMVTYSPDDNVDNSKRNKVFAKLGLKAVKGFGAVGKLIAKQGKSTMKTQKKLKKAGVGGGEKGPSERELVLQDAGKTLGDYRKALLDVSFHSGARSVSYQAMQNLFTHPDTPGSGDGPLARAYDSVQRLEALIGKPTVYNKAFWQVFNGPLRLTKDYMLEEAACQLQTDWDQKFLTAIQGVPEYKLNDLMFGDSGELWKFIDDNAKSFLRVRASAGYSPAIARGSHLPLTQQFLVFASRAHDAYQAKQDSYTVYVRALPTGSNPDARYQPSKTTVELTCADGVQSLTNFNFPVTNAFKWVNSCANTVLSIEVGRVTLQKTFSGPLGFPHFVSTFAGGRQRYKPEEFPEQERYLRDYGIKYIDVSFDFRGAQPLISALNKVTTKPPRDIAECWNGV